MTTPEVDAIDTLELELRRLPGVAFVGVAERNASLVVQVVASGVTDVAGMRSRAEQLCRTHIDGPFVVEMPGSSRPARVRILDVQVDDEVAVHLAYDGQQTVGRGEAGHPDGAAHATFEALQRLGAHVPFSVEAAALFEHQLGEGVMVVLGSAVAGERYGVAAAKTIEHAAVRATLHALNRFLATQTFAAVPA